MSLENSLESARDYHFTRCYDLYGKDDIMFDLECPKFMLAIKRGINEISGCYHSFMGFLAQSAYNLVSKKD